MRAALLQLTSSDDPAANLDTVLPMIEQAVGEGADLICTPEVTNCVSASRARQIAVLKPEAEDPTLAAFREAAARHGRHLLLGSIGLKTGDADGRFANRSFLIGPTGDIIARYDKIHMFDVQVSETETYRESAGYRPGNVSVLAETPLAKIGLTICYDVRFPHLHRGLAKAGAQILTVPAAFSPGTGPAHWQPLLQARAIETGCFVLAPAQCGTHSATDGRTRSSHGHSLVVSPWGEVLADGGTAPGVITVDLDLSHVDDARRKIPALTHDRPFEGP
ncbi:carbon-nitrogen hydrolase family protein [Vannielia litorea]|uniref:carbon-nitrogen hydrolase family protein n=1 Tax=Vannielia litorea TaxID=1217970 RepID=UPI001C942DBE|nr:carbon-nitrogen hydrolase family protein [Vannielia litorea]MBY6155191.1 carbon-nitrogen hydrolase family protein [Vannielia litorea]